VEFQTLVQTSSVQSLVRNIAVAGFSGVEGRAEYAIGDFAAAAQAERSALQTLKATAGNNVSGQRNLAQSATWLSMALCALGKQDEAAPLIGPVVAQYRALAKKNRGDQWLPLELAAALYAQSLSEPQHRPELLREAAQLVAHLTPSIAALHDTRAWRARIEKAQR
jgi:hypothetical protein